MSDKNNYKIILMAVFLAAGSVLIYYCHAVIKIGSVFTHLFYIPIILAALWWKRKGLIVAVFLAGLLISSHTFIRPDTTTFNDYLRALMFVVIYIVLAELSKDIAKIEEQRKQFTHDLQERTKELNCLYSLSKLVEQKNITPEGILQGTAKLFREAWQYPEITCARIVFESKEFKMENFKATQWKLLADIKVHEKKVGTIEVCYLEEKPVISEGPFLRQERDLIEAIAERLGRIIERKQAEKEVQQHQAELLHISRLSTIGEMASGLAHELNQPLCAILSCSDLCLRTIKTQNADKLTENLETIATQAEKAGGIIRRLKDFIQKRQPHRSTININNLIREVVGFVGSDLRHNEIKVDSKLDEQIPMVLADSIQIEQVLLNLIRNAIEAMDSVSSQHRRLIIQTLVHANNAIEVAVCDTGVGLPSEFIDQIFNSFFTTKPDGLGIGLSISYSIIEAHEGQLWVTANSDCGSTFRFTLPVTQMNSV